MNLAQLESGKKAVVTDMSLLPTDTRKKLMVMGILPHTEIAILRKAPMGNPLQISVRGTSLAIRKNLAEQITVKEL
ncbi:FeoA family protein [Aliivibrio fischeri]|uniref:FeoA family protein n=1 Tax=Aliivibrio fischeri TaxID=668 RepID=UPI00080DE98B|nr:FeoA family protein [Aliivibrio fischeri]OCH11251.1 iron transporter FeoA [Aliivibrio fischeri]